MIQRIQDVETCCQDTLHVTSLLCSSEYYQCVDRWKLRGYNRSIVDRRWADISARAIDPRDVDQTQTVTVRHRSSLTVKAFSSFYSIICLIKNASIWRANKPARRPVIDSAPTQTFKAGGRRRHVLALNDCGWQHWVRVHNWNSLQCDTMCINN